jgi:hypothetical protein
LVLYGCENLISYIEGATYAEVVENILTKRDEVIGGWRMCTMRNVEDERGRDKARLGRRGMHVGYWWDSQKERHY